MNEYHKPCGPNCITNSGGLCYCLAPKHMWPTEREHFQNNLHKFRKCNDKPKFVVIDREGPCDIEMGELGFYLGYSSTDILIHLSNGQSLLGIRPDGTFYRLSSLMDDAGFQLDERERIKVSE